MRARHGPPAGAGPRRGGAMVRGAVRLHLPAHAHTGDQPLLFALTRLRLTEAYARQLRDGGYNKE
eukprot:gene48262-38972_t